MIDPELLFERCLYIGNILAGIIYGIVDPISLLLDARLTFYGRP